MPLNWQAAPIGHYSDIAIPAVSEYTIDIDVSSYNQVTIKSYKFAVANYNNKSPLEIYFDSQPAIYVQPYTNIVLDCLFFKTVRIVNRGKKKITGQFVDKLRFDSAPSLFSSVPIQSPASGNDIILHFDDVTDANDGYSDLAIQPILGTSLDTAIKKFGRSSLLCTSGAMICSKSDFIDLSKDFTTDCWVYVDISISGYYPVFHVGYDGAVNTGIVLNLYNPGGVNTGLSLKVNGVATAPAGYVAMTNKWTHISLTKNLNTIRGFINGVLVSTVTSALTGSRNSVSLYTDNSGVNLFGRVDEFRYVNNICQWSTNFTPPQSQYL